MFVVDSNRAPKQLDAVEIVHRQDGAPLVLVLDETESLRSVCTLVSDASACTVERFVIRSPKVAGVD